MRAARPPPAAPPAAAAAALAHWRAPKAEGDAPARPRLLAWATLAVLAGVLLSGWPARGGGGGGGARGGAGDPYEGFFSEPAPDAAHCLAAPPAERPRVETGRAYVAPRCGGGIGNQLSCLGAAVAYALEFGRCVVIPELFMHSSAEAEESYERTIFRHFYTDKSILPELQSGVVEPRLVAMPGGEYGFAPFSKQKPPVRGWLAVCGGLYMNWQYWWHIRAELAALLRPPPAVTRALLAKYPALAHGVAVHFRRGDFINIKLPGVPTFSYPIPDPYYYSHAVDQLVRGLPPREQGRLTFFIFTQDWEWAQEQDFIAEFPGDIVWVDAEDEVASFYMMMLAADGIVCANSTFCLWAAVLGVFRRAVYFPSHVAPWDEPSGNGGWFFPGAEVIHSDALQGEHAGL